MRIYLFVFLFPIFFNIGCGTEKAEEAEGRYLFEEISFETSGIDFVNKIKEDSEHNIINYLYYYNGGGVSVGDVNNDGLPDIYFVANQGNNKLYLNKGSLNFEDVSDTSGTIGGSSWNTGVSMVDINGDGLLDIYVCAVTGLLDFEGHNELFVNNGDGTFSEKSNEYGLDYRGYSTQAYFFDYDKDGDLDIYIVNHAVHTTLAYGPANTRNTRKPSVGDVLFENDGGKFINVSEKANIFGGPNGYGLSASIADFNGDGWDDIYVCNDFHEDDYYYINNQDGTFKESLVESFSTISRFSMGSDAADINNDGYTDLITLDMLPNDERVLKESEGDDAMFNTLSRLRQLGYKDQYSRNMLQINANGEYFSERAILNGISSTDWSWGPLIADFDNDGYQDVFITNGILRRPNNLDFRQYVSDAFKKKSPLQGTEWLYKSIDGMPSGKAPNRIFKGSSKLFIEKTGEWINEEPSLSNGAAYADLDRDGDLDLVVNNLNDVANIYENKTNSRKNSLSLDLRFSDGNLEGIGTEVQLYTNKKVQTKRLQRSRGFLSSIDSNLHFGLDTLSTIDSLKVIWPDLKVQTIKNPKVNQNLIVEYDPSKEGFRFEKADTVNFFKSIKAIDYQHVEDIYYDQYNERLIPYWVSMQGPALDIADVDQNGFDDVFVGNSSGKKPMLFLNNGKSFSKALIPSIVSDSLAEDVDAEFLDADGDGDLDLYVASGIASSRSKIDRLDRFYININGKYEKSENLIPSNALNTSCVVSNDYDGDGDQDLFVGNLSDPDDFGALVKSYLLKNDGVGKFSIDTDFELVSKVNDAVWKDLNDDGVKDLLVATEWDKPRIFINDNGRLVEMDTPEDMNGLWQSIASFDVDDDGDQDIMLGNWGLNTKFSLHQGPLKMYHHDFDGNGENEVIIAYQIEGNYYPINSKDELVSQMKVIGQKYTSYKDFALQTVSDIVGVEAMKKSKKYEVHQLASGYLENKEGKFKTFVPFAPELQSAPINSFMEIELEDGIQLLISGNSLKVNTYHGGYTSLKGMLLKTATKFNAISDFGIDPFDDQIKATAIVPMRNENIVLILANNGTIKTYTFEKINNK